MRWLMHQVHESHHAPGAWQASCTGCVEPLITATLFLGHAVHIEGCNRGTIFIEITFMDMFISAVIKNLAIAFSVVFPDTFHFQFFLLSEIRNDSVKSLESCWPLEHKTIFPDHMKHVMSSVVCQVSETHRESNSGSNRPNYIWSDWGLVSVRLWDCE